MRLMNAFGTMAQHTILSAVPGALAARAGIDPAIAVDFPAHAPSLAGKPSVGRYRGLANYMRQFDLILTYNWGAMDAVMTRRLFGSGLPPLIHHEDGFNADEVAKLKVKRNVFRRLALPAAHAVVVPSLRLETIARDIWKQPPERLLRISNGIDVADFGGPWIDIPGLDRQPGDVVIGTMAGLRAVKNLPRLVRAAAAIAHARLVIVGEGEERGAILAEAERIGFSARLVMPGYLPRPQDYVGHFDVFALSSDSEQFPISLVEAMAAGLPCVATDVGDVMAMVAPENRSFISTPDFGQKLAEMCADRGARQAIGATNRAKARAHFDEATMISAYRALYEGALRDS